MLVKLLEPAAACDQAIKREDDERADDGGDEAGAFVAFVTMQPPGSRPGIKSLAIAPAIPPMTIHHSQLYDSNILLPLFAHLVQRAGRLD